MRDAPVVLELLLNTRRVADGAARIHADSRTPHESHLSDVELARVPRRLPRRP